MIKRRMPITLLLLILFLLAGVPVQAVTTITVNTTTDELNNDGDCSLREAIQAANSDSAVDACPAGSGADTISLPAATYTLTLGQLTINTPTTLTGVGPGTTIVEAATTPGVASSRVFLISNGATVAISGVMIRHGNFTGFGAGIWTNGTLTLTNTTVSDNIASDPFGGNGGGILNQFGATLTLTNSTVSGNTAISQSGVSQGGGIFSNGTLTIINSTFSGNTASNGGGIASFGTAQLVNTIIANSLSGGDCAVNFLTSLGHNVDTDNTCKLTDPNDLPDVDPLLGPLADNGGLTQTHALLAGSPAIDAVPVADCTVTTDQRGVARPQGAACDIGAFELDVMQATIDIKPGSDPNAINCSVENEVIAVAILTTDTFDATTVNHATVTFEGASETHIDKKNGEPRRHEEDIDGDGDTDLVLHFRLGDTDLTCTSTDGTLTGETFDGQTIEGADAVRMIDQGGGQP